MENNRTMEKKTVENNLIKDIIQEHGENILFLEEKFADALIGTGRQCGKQVVAVYDADKCIEILIDKFNMDELDALEHFQLSVDDTTEGDNKPMFINDFREIKPPPDVSGIIPDTTINDVITES